MIVEYIRYQLVPERVAGFLAAYRTAAEELKASPHCLGYELSQCREHSERFVLRIEWTSVEAHLEGFRQSAGFQLFFAAIRPYLDDIEEMTHYQLTDVVSTAV